MVSAFSYNLSHVLNVPLIAAMMGYLLEKYARWAKTGGDWFPFRLQLLATVLSLIYPVHELVVSEVYKGVYLGESFQPSPLNEGLFEDGFARPACSIAGAAFTIAASVMATNSPKSVREESTERKEPFTDSSPEGSLSAVALE